MKPEIIPFDPITKGNTFKAREFTLDIDNQDGTFTPLNLTGASIEIAFRSTAESPALKKISIGSGITLSNPTLGKFIIEQISPCDFPVGNILFDIKVTNSAGIIVTYISCVLPILQNIT